MASSKAKTARDKKALADGEMMSCLELDKASAVEVLAELYELLEEYGPSWYSEELHHRAAAALRLLREP